MIIYDLNNIAARMFVIAVTTIVTLTVATAPLVAAQAPQTPLKLFNKDSTPFDTSYGSWVGKWWQWNVNIPLEGHPRDTYNPEKCNINQQGPVWYLPDILTGSEERICTIPEGKAVLIPINTGACWNDGNPQFMNDIELKTCALEGQDGTFMNVQINGVKVERDSIERIQSPYFNLTIPKDSWTRYNEDSSGRIFECDICPVGSFRSMADGYFLFLEPLPSGEYNVKISHDTITNPNPEYRHAASVTYNIITSTTQ